MSALKDSLSYDELQKVGTTQGGNRGIVSANGGGRSAADRTYAAATEALVADVTALLAMDVYDPKRAAAVEKIKKEGNTWSGLYAPGGSSKRASGRAFYNLRACLRYGHRGPSARTDASALFITRPQSTSCRATSPSTAWRRCQSRRAKRWTATWPRQSRSWRRAAERRVLFIPALPGISDTTSPRVGADARSARVRRDPPS
jgi:hypothetical protein